jgi:hypothetical protein
MKTFKEMSDYEKKQELQEKMPICKSLVDLSFELDFPVLELGVLMEDLGLGGSHYPITTLSGQVLSPSTFHTIAVHILLTTYTLTVRDAMNLLADDQDELRYYVSFNASPEQYCRNLAKNPKFPRYGTKHDSPEKETQNNRIPSQARKKGRGLYGSNRRRTD